MKILPIKTGNFYYHIITCNSTTIGAKNIEFVQDRWVQIKLIKEDKKQRIYEYTLLNQNMDGSAVIHDLAADMEWLQSPIQVITNMEGAFIGINNFNSIPVKWEKEYRLKIFNKYQNFEGIDTLLLETDKILKDPMRFLQSFIGYSHYRCLFQSFYRNLEKEEKHLLMLKGFFGAIDLPLIIHTDNTKTNDQIKISNRATLDAEKFDRKSFVRMMKDITNTYNLKVDLIIDMEEIYQFDNNILTTSDLFLQVHVPSFYTVVSAHQCKQIEYGEIPVNSSKTALNKVATY
jgi:hypothetical protein